MAFYRVINRYATALLEDAVDLNKLEEVHQDAISFLKACKESRELLNLLKNPTIQSSKKLTIVTRIFENKFEKITIEFIKLLVKHKREELSKEIFEKFISLYKDFKGIVDAEIISAVPISEHVLENLKKHVKVLSKANDVEIRNTIKEDLIGGFALKYQDKLLDMSISNQLESLKKHLHE